MMTNRKSCQSHCCARHGCRYGHLDCPVVMKRLEQDDYCEFCMDLDEINRKQKELDAEFSHWKRINDRKTKEVISAHIAKMKAKREEEKNVR